MTLGYIPLGGYHKLWTEHRMSPVCVAMLLLTTKEVGHIVHFFRISILQINTDKGVEQLDEIREILVYEARRALGGVGKGCLNLLKDSDH